jgi:pimeloyl-ACP methyl ester carboxylesterase
VEHLVNARRVRLAAYAEGDGQPVVGLHGLTATHRYVLMGSRALERSGHRVVLYDARGHGRSTPPEDGECSYVALAEDLADVLDSFGFERAVLVGASMGAHTAVRFALTHPGRVAALVLATPAYDPAEGDARLRRWDALSEGLRAGGVAGFLDAYDFAALPAAWRATVRTVIAQRLALHDSLDAVADALAAVPRSRPFESFAELAAIAVPALVIASRDEADPEHPLATARSYAAAIAGAEILVEDPGRPPIAWQGGQLSRAIAGVVERSRAA